MIPKFQSLGFLFYLQNKAAILRICYLAYIEEHWTTNENIIDLSILKEHVILETNKGPILPQKQAVYFPPIYGNPIDLHSEFPGKCLSVV